MGERCLGPPPVLISHTETVTVQWLTDAMDWLPLLHTLPGINCVHGNELGPWTL